MPGPIPWSSGTPIGLMACLCLGYLKARRSVSCAAISICSCTEVSRLVTRVGVSYEPRSTNIIQNKNNDTVSYPPLIQCLRYL
ncbi:hypothetical protein QBC36DRAFT_106030 [Triangularia setosa]|uniref:Uncharacterized protein n=1 Tax=Triangularia setosa TaxID=2587417 RepID=A0AAN6WAE3_9PEZI|nr:hypothetical protein QBC36DRAFT_106030 [Podospora setosa]